ncbi:ubiquitin-like domain-containing CTD phosphatase 1 [Calliphora vicina]|uniref:ubiquitin-like domain-containing CTD phosphatase 1 n=1 Tax=Calliphora vicina TaxID=7373 RepID=UPI00325B4BE3
MSEVKEITIVVKWSAKEYPITDLTDQDTVAVLRHEIFKKTQVRPERQKLLNLKYKGKPAENNLKLGNLELKSNFKIMMVGSTEADIEDACQKPEDLGDIIDDLEFESEEESVENSSIYLAKIEKRIKEYKITELNPPRPGKHLLVLDIDYTLFDHRSSAETGAELMRPYLHEFLTIAYEFYDIVIWSATGMRWIEEKMRLLGVSKHIDYKIMFYLDSNAMISVHTSDRGVIDVKPLGVIWGLYPQYSAANTIMFDDIRRNFLMNPRSGLRIRPFRQAHLNRDTDEELIKLSKYLTDIAKHCKDFTKLNHRKWEHYDPRK